MRVPDIRVHMVLRGSAAWTIPIVLFTAFIVGSLMLTVLDPIWQGVFDSPMYDANGPTMTMLLDALKALATYTSLILLFGYLSRSWIWTRREG